MSDLDLDGQAGTNRRVPVSVPRERSRWHVPPGGWIALAVASLMASAALLGASGEWIHWFGYALVVLGTLVGLALFRREAYRRQNESGVAPSRGLLRFALLLVCVGLLVAAGHAWALAWSYA